MIVPDFEILLSSFKVVVPHFQGADHAQYFFVSNGIIPFLQTHGVRDIDNQMPFIVFENQEHCACSEV